LAEKSARPNRTELVATKVAPTLVVLLGASGCAALVYQVVWFQLLGIVLGASAVSVGILLATFMGGMSLGSGLCARFVSVRHHPLRVLASLELAIALLGIAVLGALPALGGIYAALGGSGTSGVLLRALIACLCLLPPTVLMGATLPIVARCTETTRGGIARIGFLYCSNVVGAVVGAVLAGFYLLREHDVAFATYFAAALNVAVALGALLLALKALPAPPQGARTLHEVNAGSWPVYLTTALSGMTALAAEVVWTRTLSLLLGATVYAFALILAVFLLGLGVGSAVGALLGRTVDARSALGACQLLLCVAIAWGAYALAQQLPYWPLDVTLPTPSAVALQLDLMRAAYAILPATLLWGVSFPLALAALAPRDGDPARLVGGVYVANTLGAVCGAVATSLLFIPWLGSHGTQKALIVTAAVGGALGLVRLERIRNYGVRHAGIAAAGIALVAVLAYAVPDLPRELVAFGRFVPTRATGTEVVFAREGRSASIAVSEESGIRTFHSAGKPQASTHAQDMRLQRMLGHLATLVPTSGRSYLVIGLGAGVTAGAVATDPRAERVVVAEIEPLARDAAAEYFRAENFAVVDNPIVDIRIDDGRHYLATTDATFDAITSDPLDPWVKGAAALYTREFWQLARARLNPGGVVTVFVQLYETTEDAVKSEIASFLEVFPNGAVFANNAQGMGYDLVLLGRAGDSPIDVEAIQRRLATVEYESVRRSLADVGFRSAVDLFGTYVGGPSELGAWLEDATLNTDRNLRLQYLAGEGLNAYEADAILRSMTASGIEFPDDLFSGSPEVLEQLRRRIQRNAAHD
jgi:spermidine synthase